VTPPGAADPSAADVDGDWSPSLDPPRAAVVEAVARAIAEDVLPLGDLTAGLVPAGRRATVDVVSRAAGVIAGRACAVEAFAQIDPGVAVSWLLPDGAAVAPGDVVATVEGPLRSILTAERTALNFLGHLSGVATLTRAFVAAVHAANPSTRVIDTRKTTPGLRALEKAAVAAGGGTNHRFGLDDAILVKENHIAAAGGIAAAVAAARAGGAEGLPIEVEVRDGAEIAQALEAGAPRLLLDNMTVAQLRAAVIQVGGRAQLEASGNVTLETLREVGATGVDFVSMGALTHSAPALDLSLSLELAG